MYCAAVFPVCTLSPISRKVHLILLQTHNFSFKNEPWAPASTLDLKSRNSGLKNRYVVCMSVQQASRSKVAVSPLELDDAKEPPLNIHKPKEPYTATIVSVERLVGPKAPGETCHIVIDHGGSVPYWEGQSYGVIPPVSHIIYFSVFFMLFLSLSCFSFCAPNLWLVPFSWDSRWFKNSLAQNYTLAFLFFNGYESQSRYALGSWNNNWHPMLLFLYWFISRLNFMLNASSNFIWLKHS